MFAGFRRYQKLIWGAVIAVVIPSFVIFFTNSSDTFFSKRGNGSNVGSINGRPVSRDEYWNALKEAEFNFYLRYHNWPDKAEARDFGFDKETEVTRRLFELEKTKELGIHVGKEATVQMAGDLLDLLSGGHVPNARQALEQLETAILKPRGMTRADYYRFIEHEIAINQMLQLVGSAGKLTTAADAEAVYRRDNEEILPELVVFSATNYLHSVTNLSAAALNAYYTNHMAEYRLPERVQVKYVKFDQTNFLKQANEQLAKITNLNEILSAEYLKRGTNFFTDKDNKSLSEAAAKEKMKNEQRDHFAMQSAMKAAYVYVNKLAEGKDKVSLQDYLALAAQSNLTVKVSAPFDRNDGPADMKGLERFVEAAFALTNTEPVSLNPLPGDDAVYVIALEKKLPSEVPPFEQVQAKVKKDYQLAQAEDMARLSGRIFYTSLTNGLAQKKTFTAICLEAKTSPVVLPAITRSTPSISSLPASVNLNALKQIAFSLEVGAASPFLPTADGGMVIYLRNRFPVDETKMKKDMPAFLNKLRDQRRTEATMAWLDRQYNTTPKDLPDSSKEKQQAPKPGRK